MEEQPIDCEQSETTGNTGNPSTDAAD